MERQIFFHSTQDLNVYNLVAALKIILCESKFLDKKNYLQFYNVLLHSLFIFNLKEKLTAYAEAQHKWRFLHCTDHNNCCYLLCKIIRHYYLSYFLLQETKNTLSQTKDSEMYKELNDKVEELTKQINNLTNENAGLAKEVADKNALNKEITKAHDKAIAVSFVVFDHYAVS